VLAWRRFRRDRLGFGSLIVVALYMVVVLATAAGWVARDWQTETGVSFAPPTFLGPEADTPQLAKRAEGAQPVADYGIPDPLAADLTEIAKTLSGSSPDQARAPTLPLGGDKWGRDVLRKALKGTETSLVVGVAAALLATFLGTLFGALAGFRGGKTDDFFNWLYSVFTSIPYLLLVLAIAAVIGQKGTLTVILILGLTGWTGIFRLVRAEYMKHKVREYVLAADAVGASPMRRMFVHILPNVSHVVLVQLSLHVVLFIKSEVILTFLGFGVGVDTVSWGSMLAEAGSELLLGKWWQLTVATVFMALLVTAFSLFTDAMRDALDPRLK
jgi:peptide/nickel transport system permease protein